MKKYSIFIIFLFGIKTLSIAQGKISGNVISNSKPIEYATIIISNTQDSSKVLQYEASDSLGKFSFANLNYGTYSVKVKLVGYVAISKNVTLNGDNKEYHLKDLNLLEDKSELNKVTVVAQKKND